MQMQRQKSRKVLRVAPEPAVAELGLQLFQWWTLKHSRAPGLCRGLLSSPLPCKHSYSEVRVCVKQQCVYGPGGKGGQREGADV